MKRTAVINVVGLTEALIGRHTPRIASFQAQGSAAVISPAFPAVTCTAQSTYLTGATASQHGIVGNGWYNRELAEVQFWKQSNHLVKGRKLWEELREMDRDFTCAKLFWWYNMYSTADYSITPRPLYPADGRKVFDIYTAPISIRTEIKNDLGEFPFPTFWGPAAGVKTPQGSPEAASRWIAQSAKWIEQRYRPTLSLIYLPHLDYNLQRCGPSCSPGGTQENSPGFPSLGTEAKKSSSPEGTTDKGARIETRFSLNPAITADLHAIDNIVGELIDFFDQAGVQVILLSEYGITNVDRPVHLNRAFRSKGWVAIKDELGLEMLDCGASKAFAVADHQVAHVYVNDPSIAGQVRDVIQGQPGVEQVLDVAGKREWGINHPRAGDFVVIAKENAWFTYYYWMDDAVAPDFARTVDIHRKPGYDPAELFLDPNLRAPKLRIATRLLQKKLGFRMLMDVVPLDASLVKGSHGRRPADSRDFPVFIAPRSDLVTGKSLAATEIYRLLIQHILS